jgi:hypothetical protein
VSFTLTVSGTGPTGSVNLVDADNANAVIASGTLSSGAATLSVSGLLPGTHHLYAVYGGDGQNAASQSGQLVQTVNAAPVTVSAVSANANKTALVGPQRSMVDSLVYTFNEPVELASGAFTIALHANVTVNGVGGQTVGTLPTLRWQTSDGGRTWVLTFSGAGVVGGSIADGVYDLTLNATAVMAVSGGGTLSSSRTDTFLVGESPYLRATPPSRSTP